MHSNKKSRGKDICDLIVDAFGDAHEGVVITDDRHRIISVNHAFTSITGYEFESVSGELPPFFVSVVQDRSFYAHMRKAIKKSGTWKGELWCENKNGELCVLRLSINSINVIDKKQTFFIGIFSDITEWRDAQRRLEECKSFDGLTGLPNRTHILEQIANSLTYAKHKKCMMAVCCLDMDNFKDINEQMGHEIGDQLLIEISSRIKSSIREGDLVARVGGDEFIALLNNIGDLHEVQDLAGSLLIQLSQPYLINHERIEISSSMGITIFPGDKSSPESMVRHADQSLYKAKQEGKNRFHLFDPVFDQWINNNHKLARRIRSAIKNGELMMYYQPKVNMRTGSLIGMEALLRWNHPQQGVIGPESFLNLHEHDDLNIEIGEWVLREAMNQMSHWLLFDELKIPVSVNIDACLLIKPDFTQQISTLLTDYTPLSDGMLGLEILESAAMKDLNQVGNTIRKCRDMGVEFAIDDFGTGYSSLAYLKHLPVNTLKIDQSFVRDMLSHKGDLEVARGVIGMADAFGLDVIAEGVETVEQGMALMSIGCDLAQGYGISKPISSQDVAAWVKQYQPCETWLRAHPIHEEFSES